MSKSQAQTATRFQGPPTSLLKRSSQQISSITWIQMHQVHERASAWTCINMQHHDPTLAVASTCINKHQQNRMYASTACWQRLSTRQGTAWPLHPTRRRGLLRQSALLTAVQTTEAKKHANSNKLTKPHTQQNATQKPSQCSQCSSKRLPVTTRQQTEHERTWQNII